VDFAVPDRVGFLGVDCDLLKRVEALELCEVWDVDDVLIADEDCSSVGVILLSFKDVV
jgi:hypothetical protein